MAIQLRSSVDEMDEFYPHEDSREVQRELWHLFEWAMEMKRSVDNLYYTDVNRIERKVAVKTATHGGMCSVVHEYDESTGEIQLMVHEAENKKEHTWCEVDLLPEDDQTILLQKSVGETVEAILGVDESGEWYVRHVVS